MNVDTMDENNEDAFDFVDLSLAFFFMQEEEEDLLVAVAAGLLPVLILFAIMKFSMCELPISAICIS